MAIGVRHTLAQRRAIGALAKTLFSSARQSGSTPPLQVPGPQFVEYVSPPPAWLVEDFVRYVGGDPARYRDALPAHLFPQWCFPTLAQTLDGLPYPITKIVNAGCTLNVNGRLPSDSLLRVAAQLESIDDNGRRALITTRLHTGPVECSDALEVELRTMVRLRSSDGARDAAGRPVPKQKPRVPANSREVKRWQLSRDAGRRYAQLTGDFNPIHWVRPYARMMGFRSVILHGFGSLSWTEEALIGDLLAGNWARLRQIDANFVRPLILPHRVGLYLAPEQRFTLGDAPGGAAYLEGRFELTPSPLEGR